MAEEKLPKFKDELRSFKFWKAVRCEFLITMLYVLIGCGSTVTWHNGEEVNEVKIALAFGLSAATMVQCVGHISGAHMNPAVTLALLVTQNISIARAVFYALAQCIGGAAGAGILYGVTPPSDHHRMGLVDLHPDLGLGQAFGVEFLITFTVVFTVFANLEPKRIDMGSRSLAIGLAICVCHLFAFRYTGACMNPARALGAAIITNHWKHHWLYWLGPTLGGIIGGFTYEYTHDTSPRLQTLRRSFRRKPAHAPKHISRTRSASNSTISTEMTFNPPPTCSELTLNTTNMPTDLPNDMRI